MSDRPLDQLTLRDLLLDLERLVNELGDHVERDVMTKLTTIRRLTRSDATHPDDPPVTDAQIRTAAAEALRSDFFSEKLASRIQAYLEAVDHVTAPIVDGT